MIHLTYEESNDRREDLKYYIERKDGIIEEFPFDQREGSGQHISVFKEGVGRIHISAETDEEFYEGCSALLHEFNHKGYQAVWDAHEAEYSKREKVRWLGSKE